MDEREFELINIVGANLAISQRDISRRLSLSLGMTNILLRRMIAKGYIRITQLNQRKVQYLLTPKGFAEKLQKSIKYTVKTIHSMGLIKDSLRILLLELYGEGIKDFWVLGQSDLTSLITIVAHEIPLKDAHFHLVQQIPHGAKGVILVCLEDFPENKYSIKTINVIHELAKMQNV